MRIALVSCAKNKQAIAAPARDLYTSQLFAYQRRYAEKFADGWYILSAEHGVLHPDEMIAPYERSLNNMPIAERRCWASRVQHELLSVLTDATQVIILAGQRYKADVEPFLADHGMSVVVPMEGLTIGRQLRWLKNEVGQ